MKKLLSLTLAILLVMSLAVPAFATNTDSANTTLTTTVDQVYIVTIPSSITLSLNDENKLTNTGGEQIEVAAGLRLTNGNELKITVSGADDEELELIDNAKDSNKYAYTINGQSKGGTVYESNTDTSATKLTSALTIITTSAVTTAATYTDSVVFTITSVVQS